MGSPVRAERGRPTGKETERGLKGVKRRETRRGSERSGASVAREREREGRRERVEV